MTDSDSDNQKLDPGQVQAIAALLTEKDTKSAAAKAGISEATIYRWLREDTDFKAALHAAEAQLIDQAVRRLAGAANDAIGVLVTIMNNKRAAASVRVRAATVVIEQLVKLRELNNFEERLAAVEARGIK